MNRIQSKNHNMHCVKSVQLQSFFWSLFSCIRTVTEYRKIRTKKTPSLDTFHTVMETFKTNKPFLPSCDANLISPNDYQKMNDKIIYRYFKDK